MPVTLVATTGMIREMVEAVGGQHVRVLQMIGPGDDPHLYDFGRYVSVLLHADLVFYNALMLEPRLAALQDENWAERINLTSIAGGIDRAVLLACPRTGDVDPHVWMDASLWAQRVENVAWYLKNMRPPFADSRYQAEFQQNAERYRARLLALDAYLRAQAARVSAERRVLVTAHHAFGYFGRAYGFEVRALQGAATTLLASTDDEVEALAEFVVARRVPAMFTETSVGTGGLERVQAAVRARGHEVRIAGPLYSDAMGAAGTPQGTFEGMMRHNVDTIVSELGPEPLHR
jgi:manganese/zinc/iron transport system substrate-binding protein